MPIVWQMPDGAVRVTQLTEEFLARERRPEETTVQAVARLAQEHVREKQKYPHPATGEIIDPLAGSTCVPIRSANMPTDRIGRHAWRLKNNRVVVDPTVPAPPHPKQALLDQVQAAASLDEMKAILTKVIHG